ncbi:hypothetical protein [Sagittula sp. S175]|uniref:hypothetical protein n=1 Tax=Sagittula sp. S175 TaxID=3415129 RepID=UPI003C7B7B11
MIWPLRAKVLLPSRIVLHVGAPKCGSSALQAALSARPILALPDGGQMCYTARGSGLRNEVLTGPRLQQAAEAAVHGYLNWPGRTREVSPPRYHAALDRAVRGTEGAPPMLSNEGWIGRATEFATHLPQWFDGRTRVDVFAAARPPLEWLNAAYWQWGVWTGQGIDDWLERQVMPYRLGSDLEAWAALPGVRLHLALTPDVVADFAERFGVALPADPTRRNAALPAAMVGFLIRNRRFRRNAHDSAVDFVLQRWCRPEVAPELWAQKLWALGPQHVQALRGPLRAEVDRLMALVPEEEVEEALYLRPGWRREAPYHSLLRAPQARLHDPEELVRLHHLLCDSAALAAQAAGRRLPPLPPPPGVTGPHGPRDAPVARVLDVLLEMDVAWRKHRLAQSA